MQGLFCQMPIAVQALASRASEALTSERRRMVLDINSNVWKLFKSSTKSLPIRKCSALTTWILVLVQQWAYRRKPMHGRTPQIAHMCLIAISRSDANHPSQCCQNNSQTYSALSDMCGVARPVAEGAFFQVQHPSKSHHLQPQHSQVASTPLCTSIDFLCCSRGI